MRNRIGRNRTGHSYCLVPGVDGAGERSEMISAWNDLMYSIICQNQNVILNRIRQKQDVDEYDWLIQTIACQPWPADFEGRYRLFFVMGRVSASYYTPYFQALRAARTQTPNLGQLCAALCPFSTRKKKQPTDDSDVAILLPHQAVPYG